LILSLFTFGASSGTLVAHVPYCFSLSKIWWFTALHATYAGWKYVSHDLPETCVTSSTLE